jgi:hypothetical protein
MKLKYSRKKWNTPVEHACGTHLAMLRTAGREPAQPIRARRKQWISPVAGRRGNSNWFPAGPTSGDLPPRVAFG